MNNTFIATFILLAASQALGAGWQLFKVNDFSSLKNNGYLSALDELVDPDTIDLEAPYRVFGFNHRSQCEDNWLKAYHEGTGGQCKRGNERNKCSIDFWVILPCEAEVLNLTKSDLSSVSWGIEQFLNIEHEEVSPLLRSRMVYAAKAFKKSIRIYESYQNRKISLDEEAYKREVRDQIGVEFDQMLLKKEGLSILQKNSNDLKRSLTEIMDANSALLERWNFVKAEGIHTEKSKISEFKNYLVTIAKDQRRLTWDSFDSAEQFRLQAIIGLEDMETNWRDLDTSFDSYIRSVEALEINFRAAHRDGYFGTAAGASAIDKELHGVTEVLNHLRKVQGSIKNRSESLKNFKSQYLEAFSRFQANYVSRISLQSKDEHRKLVKEVVEHDRFTRDIIPITNRAWDKLPTANSVNIPYLKDRIATLKEIIAQQYRCAGQLPSWKEPTCNIVNDHVLIAKSELEELPKKAKFYLRMLKFKMTKSNLDTTDLNRLPEEITRANLDDIIQVYDAKLRYYDLYMEDLAK